MEYTKEQLARMWLRLPPIAVWNRLDALRDRMGSASALWDDFTPDLYDALGKEAYSLLADAKDRKCGTLLRQLEGCGARAVFFGDADYPALLSQIPDPPDVLFVRGTLALDRAVAMVGSRRNTRYGATQAKRIAGELAANGIAVVSGLARGIDTASHEGALAGGGVTVAVLGCGLTQHYPPENKELSRRIVESGGAIVTEYPPDAPPLQFHFPIRNRIISGLCQALLLVEAQEKSGTHSTVRHALEQGREVFALPGNVDSPGSELPLKLLKEGAGIATCAQDIMAAMGWRQRLPVQQSLFPREEDGGGDDPILQALEMEEKTLEELLAETGLPVDELSTRLTLLELGGKIQRRAGRAYARC